MKAEDKSLIDIFYHLENGGNDRAKKELEQYANKRVIEELESMEVIVPPCAENRYLINRLRKVIKELKLNQD